MYKNQLQELAQRSCFNLPSYSCIREGPDHAPRFKATVNFNGETFESPSFCSTLRQAEHAAAEVALNTLANRGPSKALAARVLDETGVYKNLLQETAHRAGLNLPVYTTIRSGPGHVPVFSCTVEIAGMSFTGEAAKTKKQAQKNAAMTAWSALRKLSQRGSPSSPSVESECNEEQEQVIIARVLASLRPSKSNNKQNDRQHGQQRSGSICRDSTPQTPISCSMQYQSMVDPSFFPEMAMYQMWQQEQLAQLQNRLLALPVPLAPQPSPHFFPFMQSMFRPDHCLYFPTEVQQPITMGPRFSIAASGSSFYLSNHLVPEPMRGRSMVTIQEIEEKTEERSEFSPSEVSVSPALGDNNTEAINQEPIQEDNKQNTEELGGKIATSVQLERNQPGQFDWTSRRSVDSRLGPIEFQLQRPHGFDSSQSNPRPYHPPGLSSYRSSRPPSTVAAPVMTRTGDPVSSVGLRPQNLANQMPAPPRMRTGIPPYSFRPRPERMDFGRGPPRAMAPAVQIRTVVPVCSAPPARKIPSSSQEGLPPYRENKNAE
ncbi:hypothetical protein AAG906_026590 [Vitis piasezkii]